MKLTPEDRKKLNEVRSAIQARASAKPHPSRTAGARGGSAFADFASFRTMVSPDLLRLLFWLGAVGMMAVGRVATAQGHGATLPVALVGVLVWRIFCEVSIVFFRIHEALVDILGELEARPQAAQVESSPDAT